MAFVAVKVSPMASAKGAVIEHLFRQRFRARTRSIDNPVVTFDDLQLAIQETKAKLSAANPANFWKDIIRGKRANEIWPASVRLAGFTGEDAIGDSPRAAFRFVPMLKGQTTAFPLGLAPSSTLLSKPRAIESLSIPFVAKQLGRKDENWLAQVIQRLRIVETHFATASNRQVVEVDFLQTGLKLRNSEIDAAYRIALQDGRLLLVSVEAKGRSDEIWPAQVARAAKALATTAAATQAPDGVIPFAAKIVGRSLIYTVEFAPLAGDEVPKVASEALFQLVPPVPGVE